MKYITTLILTICLLSPFAQAETTLFGITLGKSSVSDLQQRYNTKQHISTSYPEGWHRYIVPVSEIPALADIATEVSFSFTNKDILGGVSITYLSSEHTFKVLKSVLDANSPTSPALYNQGRIANYQTSDTYIRLEYAPPYGTDLTYTDQNYRRLLKEANEQRKRDFQANKLKKEP
jgi:hypothetical protein